MIEIVKTEERELQTDSRERLTVRYELVREPQPGLDLYGVRICIPAKGESAAAYRISPDGARVRQLLRILAKHAVTPCTLHEILQEIL